MGSPLAALGHCDIIIGLGFEIDRVFLLVSSLVGELLKLLHFGLCFVCCCCYLRCEMKQVADGKSIGMEQKVSGFLAWYFEVREQVQCELLKEHLTGETI